MMKKQLSNFGYLILVSLFSASFAAQAQKYSSSGQQADVYVAGSGGCRDNTRFTYYKNGQQGGPLMNGKISSATSILIVGSDVYVTGDLDFKPVYWKNGQVVQLPSTATSSGNFPSGAFSIAVTGNDVYVAGNGYKPNRGGINEDLQPRYWKNGQEILLPLPPDPNGGDNDGSADFIAVVNNDVYVIGRDIYYTPLYWKNGQLVKTVNNELQRVVTITTLNGDVYAVGAHNKQAAYWKNGQTKVLTTEESLATAIAVAGNDVYVTGVIGSYYGKNLYPGYGNGGMGKYWKNGQPVELSGAISPYPTSIAVAGSDVYVAGIDQGNMRFMLWKNGQPVELGNDECALTPRFVVSVAKNGVNKTPAKSNTQKKEYVVPQSPKEESDKFLAENKKKPGIITTASGLQYQVIKEGTGAKPTLNDRVKVSYHGTLINGEVFNTTLGDDNPTTITSVKNAVAGWTEGVLLMKTGGKYKFFIPASLAYGNNSGGKIRPGDALIYEIELLGIVN